MHKLDFRIRIVGKVTGAQSSALTTQARALEMACLDAGLEVHCDLNAVSDGVDDGPDLTFEETHAVAVEVVGQSMPTTQALAQGVVAKAIEKVRGRRRQ